MTRKYDQVSSKLREAVAQQQQNKALLDNFEASMRNVKANMQQFQKLLFQAQTNRMLLQSTDPISVSSRISSTHVCIVCVQCFDSESVAEGSYANITRHLALMQGNVLPYLMMLSLCKSPITICTLCCVRTLTLVQTNWHKS
jgi:hypothetical protein